MGGKWDATCEASRQPSVFMLTRRAANWARGGRQREGQGSAGVGHRRPRRCRRSGAVGQCDAVQVLLDRVATALRSLRIPEESLGHESMSYEALGYQRSIV